VLDLTAIQQVKVLRAIVLTVPVLMVMRFVARNERAAARGFAAERPGAVETIAPVQGLQGAAAARPCQALPRLAEVQKATVLRAVVKAGLAGPAGMTQSARPRLMQEHWLTSRP
jgi:hypothetical protein